MTFTYKRIYSGPVKGALVDAEGVLIDASQALTVKAVQEAFADKGIKVSDFEVKEAPLAEIKATDKTRKRALVASILRARKQDWAAGNEGKEPTDWDTEALVKAVNEKLDVLLANAKLDAKPELGIPCAIAVDRSLGSTLTRLGVSAPTFHSDDYKMGGTPWRVYAAAEKLEVAFPPHAFVRVASSAQGVEEGLNAGAWTIAVTTNPIRATEMTRAGAHFLVNAWADVAGAIAKINERLARGEQP